MNRETETERREQLQRELEAEAREKHEQAARLKQKEVISPNSQRRKAEDSAKADRYCNKDGGKPDLDALAQLDRFEYGQVRKETAARSGVTVAILEFGGVRPAPPIIGQIGRARILDRSSQPTARLTARIY